MRYLKVLLNFLLLAPSSDLALSLTICPKNLILLVKKLHLSPFNAFLNLSKTAVNLVQCSSGVFSCIKISSMRQSTPWCIRLPSGFENNVIPNGKRLKWKRPNGVINVVSFARTDLHTTVLPHLWHEPHN